MAVTTCPGHTELLQIRDTQTPSHPASSPGVVIDSIQPSSLQLFGHDELEREKGSPLWGSPMEWEQPQLVVLRFQPHPLLFWTGWSPQGSGSQADWNLLSQPSLAGFLQGSFTLHPLPHTGGVGGGL